LEFEPLSLLIYIHRPKLKADCTYRRTSCMKERVELADHPAFDIPGKWATIRPALRQSFKLNKPPFNHFISGTLVPSKNPIMVYTETPQSTIPPVFVDHQIHHRHRFYH